MKQKAETTDPEKTPITQAAETIAATGETKPRHVLTASEEHLPVKLTDDELRERGRELALKCEERERSEEEQKAVKSSMKSDLDAMDSKVAELSRIVKDGEEKRFVGVRHELTADGTMVESVRIDTGEVLRSRRATDNERQFSLFLNTVPEGAAQ